jgi:hypothetical protein
VAGRTTSRRINVSLPKWSGLGLHDQSGLANTFQPASLLTSEPDVCGKGRGKGTAFLEDGACDGVAVPTDDLDTKEGVVGLELKWTS